MKITTKILMCFGLWLLVTGMPDWAHAQPALATMAAQNEEQTTETTDPSDDALSDTAETTFSYYDFLDAGVARTREQIADTITGLETFPDEMAQTGDFLSSDIGRRGLMRLALFTVIFVGVGLIVEFLYRRAAAPLCSYLEAQHPTRFFDRLRQMVLLSVLSLLSLTVFAIG